MAAPIGHTCRDIDKCLKLIKSAIKTAEWGMKNTEVKGELYDAFRDIINEIEDVPGILEELRGDNTILRSWGEECEATMSDLENEVSKLEGRLEEYNSTDNIYL